MTGHMHWRRFDWTFDSICLKCFATIANAKEEEELAEYERDHVYGERCSRRSVPRSLLLN
jgi:hypothetical protein